MARFVSGDVVVVPFPFTDLSSAKVRPALVLTSPDHGERVPIEQVKGKIAEWAGK